MFGIIYTPTESEDVQNYSRIFRKPSGCFLDINNPEGIDQALQKWGEADEIDLIVVSDGEQVSIESAQSAPWVLIYNRSLVLEIKVLAAS